MTTQISGSSLTTGSIDLTTPLAVVDGGTGVSTDPYRMVTMTAQNSTSGTSVDFTGIPSWAKRITVMFSGVSTNGATSDFLVRLGSGSVTITGYLGASMRVISATASTVNHTTGFLLNYGQSNLQTMHGNVTLTLLTGTTWTATGHLADSNATGTTSTMGRIVLAGACDRVSITTLAGDTFDAGSINVMYEG